jgi:hypothetical protein
MCFLGYDAGTKTVRVCVGASVLAGKALFGLPQSGKHCATETSGGLAGSGPNTRVSSRRRRSHVQQQTAGEHSAAWWNVTMTNVKYRHQSGPFPPLNSFSFIFYPKGHVQVRAEVPCHHRQHTGLIEMIVGVLTTCHTQYTWDSSICVFI